LLETALADYAGLELASHDQHGHGDERGDAGYKHPGRHGNVARANFRSLLIRQEGTASRGFPAQMWDGQLATALFAVADRDFEILFRTAFETFDDSH